MNNSKIDTIEIQSKVLGKAMAMMVYVPADFTEGLPTLSMHLIYRLSLTR